MAVGKEVGKLVKIIATCFVGTAMSISRPITKWYLRKILGMDYLIVDLDHYYLACSCKVSRAALKIRAESAWFHRTGSQ